MGRSVAFIEDLVPSPRVEGPLARTEIDTMDAPQVLGSTVAGAIATGATLRPRYRSRTGGSMLLPHYASRGPARFLLHYVLRHWVSHTVVLIAVLSAVGCAIGSQYAVKHLVDVLGLGNPSDWQLWGAVGLLLGLVAGDNLLWRLAGWVAAQSFRRGRRRPPTRLVRALVRPWHPVLLRPISRTRSQAASAMRPTRRGASSSL